MPEQEKFARVDYLGDGSPCVIVGNNEYIIYTDGLSASENCAERITAAHESSLKDRERAAFERAKERAAKAVREYFDPTLPGFVGGCVHAEGIEKQIRSIRFEEGK